MIKPGKMIERLLDEPAANGDVTMGGICGDVGPTNPGYEALEVVAEPWEIVLCTEDGAQALLRDRYRVAKEKSKKKPRRRASANGG